jgi:PhnB protein
MSTTKQKYVQPYLFFDGRCEEAIEFYKKAIGINVEMLMRYKDSPDPNHCGPPGSENKIMHASFKIGDSLIMASDGRCAGKETFQGFALSIPVQTEAEADKLFAALSEGGQVVMPLTKTFYSPKFGMLTDRFGLMWMVIMEQK